MLDRSCPALSRCLYVIHEGSVHSSSALGPSACGATNATLQSFARVVFCLMTHSAQEESLWQERSHWGAPLAVACVAGEQRPCGQHKAHSGSGELHLAYWGGLLDGQTCTRGS
jgi:hypothetical protein